MQTPKHLFPLVYDDNKGFLILIKSRLRRQLDTLREQVWRQVCSVWWFFCFTFVLSIHSLQWDRSQHDKDRS